MFCFFKIKSYFKMTIKSAYDIFQPSGFPTDPGRDGKLDGPGSIAVQVGPSLQGVRSGRVAHLTNYGWGLSKHGKIYMPVLLM